MADEKTLKLRPPIAHPDGAEHRRLISGSVQGLLDREILQETLANRPAAGTANKLFVSTDEPILYRDNGSSWEVVRGILADTFANRPAAGNAGSFFYATDENWIYRDNGSSWESFGAVRNSGGVPEILADTLANRPSAGTAGNLFVSTDEPALYRDTGAVWEVLSRPTPEIEIVRKTANETVNNSVTLQDDDDLLIALAANEVVMFQAFITHVSNSTADFKCTFTVPSGANGGWGAPNASVTTADALQSGSFLPFASALSMQGSTSDRCQLFSGVVRNGGNAGNLTFQWAQNTAAVVDTKVLQDSFIMALRE